MDIESLEGHEFFGYLTIMREKKNLCKSKSQKLLIYSLLPRFKESSFLPKKQSSAVARKINKFFKTDNGFYLKVEGRFEGLKRSFEQLITLS